MPKIASTIDAIAPKNAIPSIVDAILGDCWTHNNESEANSEIKEKKKIYTINEFENNMANPEQIGLIEINKKIIIFIIQNQILII